MNTQANFDRTLWTVVFAPLAAWALVGQPILLAQSVNQRDYDTLEEEIDVEPLELERAIIERTNRFRAEQQLDQITADDNLTRAARYFARYMAHTDQYGHEADGNRPADRAEQHGYEYCIVLENIAYQFIPREVGPDELAERLVDGWIDSPRHRENLADPDVTDVGVAVAQSEETGNYYAVQKFGRPRDLQITFRLENRSGEPVAYTVDGRSYKLPPRMTRTHARCRPSEIDFGWTEQPDIERPADGAHYVISTDAAGELQVERRE